MEELSNYQEYLNNAMNWVLEALPDLISAVVIFIVGSWFIRLINKLVRKFFEKKDYDLALETFLQSFWCGAYCCRPEQRESADH